MSLLIDLVILALLVGVLGYAVLVDRRVRRLVAVLREMEPMIDDFSAAVDKSETSVSAMKSLTRTFETRAAREALDGRGDGRADGRADGRGEGPAFRTSRQPEPRPTAGVASVTGKADLVRGFFDTVRSREA